VPLLPLPPLGKGDRVRVSKGVFCGVEGTVVARRGADRLIIAVELIEQGVTIEVDSSKVQSLETQRGTGFGR
jgi:transcription antitermination factor NusG